MENTERSRRDVIVFRGIWYLVTLLSLVGLSISLNLLWPPGGKSPALSRFLRDGAVSTVTFYAVTLFRYFLFTGSTPSSNSYKDFTTDKERIPQVVFAEFSILVLFCYPCLLVDHVDRDVLLYMSLFTISLFTGGTGLIQLSDKFRMDMKHAYITLLCGWLFCLFGTYIMIYLPSMAVAMIFIGAYWMFAVFIYFYNFPSEEFS
ncbi:hypothetical protein HA466_0140590 [Hirschfeldia incana]|nr:hypothetical protein HA466_0140590 [Hirschfeldia incana]